MKTYSLIAALLMGIFLFLFLLVEALQIPILVDPSELMSSADWGAAGLGIGLLMADVLLPVPSSLIMIAHGAVFGVALGTLLSLVGSTGAALVGFGIGRRGGRWLQRLVDEGEQARANALLQKWGWLAVIVSRPVPILAETVAVMAGTSGMRWSTMVAASVCGSIPAAFLYAVTGATAARVDHFLLTFALVLLMAGLFWAVNLILHKKLVLQGGVGV